MTALGPPGWVGGRPDDVAVVTTRGRWTYVDLAVASRTIGERLDGLGSLERRLVAVRATAPGPFLAGLLAVLARGGAALPVPVDRTVPARAKVIATLDPGRRGRETSLTAGADHPRELPADTALVLSTSGSSAGPRLVALGATGVAANVEAILGYLPIAQAPRTGLVVPLTYSYGLVGQALTTLRVGGTLFAVGADPRRLCQVGVRGLSTVPASLRRIAEDAGHAGVFQPRYVASAGAPLDPATIAAVRTNLPGARFFNQYGLTEASPRVTQLERAAAPEAFDRGCVGHPLEGIAIAVQDERGAECPPGIEGSIVVHTPSAMLGYLDDPEATAAALSERGLVTGDRGWLDERGRLFVSGRDDDVVQVAGERVSLGEVNAFLERDPAVSEARVVAVAAKRTGARLVAVVACAEDALDALRERVRSALPPAARPTRYVVVEALPRSERGKIDGESLRRLAEARN